ncbi:hypothetical protein V8G54_019453 [Vigna mungo]|uniref:Chromo domain-containing protein n=1 Tax=Vigna mungo TaxID=3915 RepID=A0AAQ3RTR7_VIGMU
MTVNMHTLNVFFLLGDAALNCLPVHWSGMSFFVLWTSLYVIFQWTFHAFSWIWWPYPFLTLSSPYSPLWYDIFLYNSHLDNFKSIDKCFTEDWEIQPQFQDILKLRYNREVHAEVLVKWVQPPDCDNAWETIEDLQLRFLDLYLLDKVKVLRSSIQSVESHQLAKGILRYLLIALLHIPCYAMFKLIVEIKHYFLSKWFPSSTQF